MKAASIDDECTGEECPLDASKANTSSDKLKRFFEAADLNGDGVLDNDEFEALVRRIGMYLSDDVKEALTEKIKDPSFLLADMSFDVVLNLFVDRVQKPAVCRPPIVSKDLKRVVFVGGTGAGKVHMT
jgi:Ca2+-binding EF-hand superfamily protein